jgi:osmoprotectant transport system permease protein
MNRQSTNQQATSKSAPQATIALRRFLMGLAAFGLLIAMLPFSRPIFAWLFPHLERPLYQQHHFLELLLSHFALVLASSVFSVVIGVGAAIYVTRPAGQEFRRLVEILTAMGQTFPPVAVLALTVPVIGFGFWPAFAALVLYSILPICENTVAGVESVSMAAKQAGRGLGMTPRELLFNVELPLAAPVILAGIRTSVTINISTAAIASTVGAVSLGLPIIIGLNGNNIAYVLQGAVLVTGLALVVDLGFEALLKRLQRWTSD